MGVLRVVKGEDLVKEAVDDAKYIQKILPFTTLYISLVKKLKGKKILID